jgi:hypothetical protein
MTTTWPGASASRNDPSPPPSGGVELVGAVDGEGYEAWVAGLDSLTGEPRGRLSRGEDGRAVSGPRVVERAVRDARGQVPGLTE